MADPEPTRRESRAERITAAERERSTTKEQVFTFASTPLFISLPPVLGGASTIGHITGTWRTRPISRVEFEVTAVDAMLHLPPLSFRHPEWREQQLVVAGPIPLERGAFEVPAHLREVFPLPNHGWADARHRLIRAVLAIDVHLSLAAESDPGTAPLLLLSVGTVQEDRSLLMSGIGIVTGGLLLNTVVCCAGSKPGPVPVPTVPPPAAPAPAPPPSVWKRSIKQGQTPPPLPSAGSIITDDTGASHTVCGGACNAPGQHTQENKIKCTPQTAGCVNPCKCVVVVAPHGSTAADDWKIPKPDAQGWVEYETDAYGAVMNNFYACLCIQ